MDISDFVENQGCGVKGLVDTGIQTVPKEFIQPPHQRLDSNKLVPHELASIPVIDLLNWSDPTVTEAIQQAASGLGFFQIINHGIPLQLLQDLVNSGHRFFELPIEEKIKYLKGKSIADTVTLSTGFGSSPLKWKDVLSFSYIGGDNEAAAALWPMACKEQVLAYMKHAEPLIKKLLGILLKKLNVDELDASKENAFMGSLKTNFSYYPKCPNPELVAGALPHCDLSSITLLLQDQVGGLYIRAENGDDKWMFVPPVEGALVVNIGDVLQIASNNVYKSIEHRVVPDKIHNRISVAVFTHPGKDAVIGPLPEIVGTGDSLVYREMAFSDYYNYYFSSKGPIGPSYLKL